MKFVKKALVVLGVLIVVLVVFLLTQPDETTIERSISINAPAAVVFEQVNGLKNWESWSYWKKQDPTMVNAYGEQVAGTGAWYSWTSENSGTGRLEITETVPNQVINTKIEFDGQGQGRGYWKFEEIDGATQVTWGFISDADGNLIGRFFNLMLDGMIAPSFEQGLSEIKSIAEATPTSSLPITTKHISGGPVLGISGESASTDSEAVGASMALGFGQVMEYMNQNNIKQRGMPGAIYTSMDPVVMTCVIGVAEGTEGSGDIVALQSYEGKVVEGIHKGDYANLSESHAELTRYMQDNALEPAGAPFEVYATDPGIVTDTTQWVTYIFYPFSR